MSERGARISSFALFRITRTLVRLAKNTARAFHAKNEKPFAHRCKSAKNQLRSAVMFFGLELICNTFVWYFRVSHYCVTTSIDLWTDHACFYCLLKLLLRLLLLLNHFLSIKPFTQHEYQVRFKIVCYKNKKRGHARCMRSSEILRVMLERDIVQMQDLRWYEVELYQEALWAKKVHLRIQLLEHSLTSSKKFIDIKDDQRDQ